MDEKRIKLLKKIVSDVAGPSSEKLVDLLYKKQNVNEFIIAKKLGGTINQTRNILYKLSDKGLIEFIRKKDKKKGGWYTYFWTLKTKRVLQMHKESIEKEISNLEEQLKIRINERYFHCPNCESEYDEEDAMLKEFICSECGEVLQIKESNEAVSSIKKEIEKKRDIVSQLESEIKAIEEKEQKAQQRRTANEQKKKKLERAKKKKQKEKANKKLESQAKNKKRVLK